VSPGILPGLFHIAALHFRRDWPISAAPVAHRRVRYQESFCRAHPLSARQLMTLFDVQLMGFAALR